MDPGQPPELPLTEEQEERYQNAIAQLKAQIDHEANLGHRLRVANANNGPEDKWMEDLFVSSIDRVKQQILNRRVAQASDTLSMKKGQVAELARKNEKGINGITLEDFTATERKIVVDDFLSHSEVLNFLLEQFNPGALQGDDAE